MTLKQRNRRKYIKPKTVSLSELHKTDRAIILYIISSVNEYLKARLKAWELLNDIKATNR